MGSNQFQREYIEYLQKKNSELLDRLNLMKESYENKILSKDLNKDYLISTLEEVLSTCRILPQEIDSFFDKITAAMGAFKDILLRKAEIMQLMEKISRMLNASDDFRSEYLATDPSGLFKEQFSESKFSKKVGTVKVSPMINGHIISTEPRIYLSRVPRVYTPGSRHNALQLSPIIEASPDTSSDPSDLGSQIFKKITIPLERLNINKLSYGYITEESPKSRFKGPKTWKKSLLNNKHNSRNQQNPVFLENNENINRKLSVREEELPQESETLDPLEGPSWLYEENPELNSSSRGFVDYRRRKHRFAAVFDRDENCLNYFERKSRKSLKDSTEFYENHLEANDKEGSKEIKERVSDNSEDFICESFSHELREQYSPGNKKRRSCRREFKEDLDANYSSAKFEEDLDKMTSTPYLKAKKKNKSDTSINSKSSNEWDNEKNFKKAIKAGKSFTKPKLSQENKSEELIFERTPKGTDYEDAKIERKKCKKNSRSLIKNVLGNEVIVEIEDCMTGENSLSKSNTSNSKSDFPSEEKKLKRSKAKKNSESPKVQPQRDSGRPKRKAANIISLAEPNLKRKVRRE